MGAMVLTNYELFSIAFTIGGMFLTGINIFVTSRVKLEVANIKVWALEKFVTRADHVAVIRAAVGFKNMEKHDA
jgi:hypothetical protein